MSNKVKRKSKGKSKDAQELKERRTRKEATEKTTDLFVAISCMVLRDKFGFGRGRMDKYMEELYNLADSVRRGYCSVEDLFRTLREETGIDFSKF